jgi:hypothetical protein
MKIYKFVNRVPGGLMVVPLFIGMAINTSFPDLLKIGGLRGSARPRPSSPPQRSEGGDPSCLICEAEGCHEDTEKKPWQLVLMTSWLRTFVANFRK